MSFDLHNLLYGGLGAILGLTIISPCLIILHGTKKAQDDSDEWQKTGIRGMRIFLFGTTGSMAVSIRRIDLRTPLGGTPSRMCLISHAPHLRGATTSQMKRATN